MKTLILFFAALFISKTHAPPKVLGDTASQSTSTQGPLSGYRSIIEEAMEKNNPQNFLEAEKPRNFTNKNSTLYSMEEGQEFTPTKESSLRRRSTELKNNVGNKMQDLRFTITQRAEHAGEIYSISFQEIACFIVCAIILGTTCWACT